MCASTTQWKARSHEAYHGYSHLSGMAMMSWLLRWRQPAFRPEVRASCGRMISPVEPARDVVMVELLAP